MNALAQIISVITQILTFAILFRVLLSWVVRNPNSQNETLISIYRVLTQITEPILAPLRRIVPTVGMFDLTPIVAMVLIQIIGSVLISALSA